jgi:hypothetical protein
MIYNTVIWLNAFPPKGGVSTTLSPRTINTGTKFDFNQHREYVQVHEENLPTNSLQARTVGAICLGPCGNLQGGYLFYNLRTGKKITRRKWTTLPMPREVIDRVNLLGEAESQPTLLTFCDRHGREIGDHTDYTSVPRVDSGDITSYTEIPGVDTPEDDENSTDLLDPVQNIAGVEQQLAAEPLDLVDDPQFDDDNVNDDLEVDNENSDDHIPVPDTPDELDQVQQEVPIEHNLLPPDQQLLHGDTTEHPDITHPAINVRRSKRPPQPVKRIVPSFTGKKYETTVTTVSDQDTEFDSATIHPDTHMRLSQGPDYDHVIFMTMTQVSMKEGEKRWGKPARDAVSKELEQLQFRDTFEPVDHHTLSKEEYDQVLESHLFLKQKRDDTIKGRMVAGGNKQRGTIDKEDASSPTAALESVLLTATIDAAEGRDVAVIDIPNAFVQTRIEDEADKVVMRLRGALADLMVKTAPEIYRKYVTVNKKGETVLYVRALNAIYGIMKAALLFYKKFIGDLMSIGFELNPYDPCVANKMVNGKQLTCVWHVDDIKASHVSTRVVTRLGLWLKKTYERLFRDGSGKMKISRGKVHDYLGMNLDYTTAGEVKVTMIPYVNEMIADFRQHDPNPDKTALTPAGEFLFKVNEDAAPLREEQSKIFHTFVAKALFATKRAQPDIHTAVAFLTTRVRVPDQDDWKKLVRMMQYLRGTPELPLTLRADGTNIVKWWVDGSYAVHPTLRSHTGGLLSLGKGSVQSISTKQKINTTSSTETELVAASDLMPHILWTNYFLNWQGYNVKDTILYQDNKSAILLEKNGKKSSTKRTKHINVRYFFITDRVKANELSIEHCGTADMVADYFTKPLQGKLFYKFRKDIMNLKD